MAVQRGGLCALYVDGVKIGHSTNATLTINLGTRSISTKDTGAWDAVAEALASWSADGDFLFEEAATEGFSTLFADLSGRSTVTLRWTSDETGDKYYEGTALPTSLSTQAGLDSDTQTFSASFQGTGALTEGTQT